jgi:hypothetical protein
MRSHLMYAPPRIVMPAFTPNTQLGKEPLKCSVQCIQENLIRNLIF